MRLENLTGYVPSIKRVKAEIPQVGFTTAIKNELDRSGLPLDVNIPQKTEETLRRHPVLLLGHHTGHYIGSIEWLAAIPHREDMAILGDIVAFQFWLKGINLPSLAGIEGVTHQETKSRVSKLIRWYRGRYLEGKADLRSLALKNKNSYKEAVDLLANGGMVALTPDGGRGPQSRWTHRTGGIINGLPEAKQAQVVLSWVDNRSGLGLLALAPEGRRLLPGFAKRDSVSFSEPMPFCEVRHRAGVTGRSRADNIEVTRYLEKIHREKQE